MSRLDGLKSWLSVAKERVWIVSPYMSPYTLQECLSEISDQVAVTIICSWRTSDLVSGSSSLDLYALCKERGWSLRVNHDRSERVLHLKAYVVDGSRAMVGSANMTHRGLITNIEALVEVEKSEIGQSVEESFEHSLVVGDSVFDSMSEHLSQIDSPEEEELPRWSPPGGDQMLIQAVMDAMPSRPTPHDLVGVPSLGQAMGVRGLRFSEVRRIISKIGDFSREGLSQATEDIMHKVAEDPRLDIQTGPHRHHTKCLVWRLQDILNDAIRLHLGPNTGKPMRDLGLNQEHWNQSLRGSRSQIIRETCLSLLPPELGAVIQSMSTWDATISLNEHNRPKENRPVGPNILLDQLPQPQSRPEILDSLWLPSFCVYQTEKGMSLGDVILGGLGFWEPTYSTRSTISEEFESDMNTIRETSENLRHGDKSAMAADSNREYVFVKVRTVGGRGEFPLGSPERPMCHYLTKDALAEIASAII